MTAVTRLAIYNNWPVILGDLLLSGPEQSGRRVCLPTIEDITDIFPEGSGYVPVGLQQKIAVVTDNLVIGWAGSYIAAKIVIGDLHAKSKIEPFTKDSLSDYFSSIGQDIWDQDVGFIGFVKDPHGIASFGYQYTSLPTSLFGEVGFLGSGSEGLQFFLNQFSELPNAQEGNPNILESSLSFALSLSGLLLNTELATLESLLHFYGGGYEIASLSGGKFQKLDDVTYVFWIARVTDREVRIAQVPRHAFSYAYSDDILTIRSVSFDETKDRVSVRQAGYGVPPIYRQVTKEELASLKVPALSKKWLCNYFLVIPHSGRRAVFARVDYRATGERYIRFLEEGKKVVVAVEKEFIERVGEDIFRHFNT